MTRNFGRFCWIFLYSLFSRISGQPDLQYPAKSVSGTTLIEKSLEKQRIEFRHATTGEDFSISCFICTFSSIYLKVPQNVNITLKLYRILTRLYPTALRTKYWVVSLRAAQYISKDIYSNALVKFEGRFKRPDTSTPSAMLVFFKLI